MTPQSSLEKSAKDGRRGLYEVSQNFLVVISIVSSKIFIVTMVTKASNGVLATRWCYRHMNHPSFSKQR
jgi:hypothetical protein